MNISNETIEALSELGYKIHFQDNNLNLKEPKDASEMYIGFQMLSSEEMQYIGKTIKATKKETTVEYVLDKINADKTFKNFSSEFNKIISKFGFNAYPTSYGIGVFVAVSLRNSAQITRDKIESTLNGIGVKFTTEYSDAGWVFRYKISKSADNIQIIQNFKA